MQYKAVVYGKDDCSHCVKVKTALALNGIPYRYVDVLKDSEALQYVKDYWTKRNTDTTVPLVVINGEDIGGKDDTIKWLSKILYS